MPEKQHDPDFLSPDVLALIKRDHEKEQQQLEALRNNPHLRIEAVKLIDALDDFLDGHAHDFATANLGRYPTQFEVDAHGDLLVWALAEFLIQAQLDREPNAPPIVQRYQTDESHACDWFDVSTYPGRDGYIALSREDK